MSKLTSRQRKAMPIGEFALPGRRYPIEDIKHARLAIQMAGRGTTPEEEATVKRKVKKKYPSIGGMGKDD